MDIWCLIWRKLPPWCNTTRYNDHCEKNYSQWQNPSTRAEEKSAPLNFLLSPTWPRKARVIATPTKGGAIAVNEPIEYPEKNASIPRFTENSKRRTPVIRCRVIKALTRDNQPLSLDFFFASGSSGVVQTPSLAEKFP